jgi:hypothetical protein
VRIPSWLEADPALHSEAVYIEADRFLHQKILLAIGRRTIHSDPNQVELWFARIERDVIARGVFTSVPIWHARCADTSTSIQPTPDLSSQSIQTPPVASVVTNSLRHATSSP